jgi:hypothetical protein
MIKIEYRSIASLKTHERNPRTISDTDFATLQTSIKDNPEYFEVRPILCTPDGVVFAGNMRLRAAIAIGLEKVPCAVMDIPEAKQRELMIRDNIQNGRWDHDILGADFEIGELKGWGFDVDTFGVPNFAPTSADTRLDETQQWVYTCGECGTEHVFTKKDLKPYEPKPDTES